MHKSNRLIASHFKNSEWPTIIFFCCIHGNERAGYIALQSFFKRIHFISEYLKGNIFGIFGNNEAYSQKQRFIDKDLNRIWTKSHFQEAIRHQDISEYQEVIEIYDLLHKILGKVKSTVYSIDLHTTSGPTKPFIVMNDALNNRAFVRSLGYPVIFNIETFIEGSLLNLMNDLGHISIAFEGGEHYSENSITEIEAFCYKALFHSGIMNAEYLIKTGISETYFKPNAANYFEIVYRQNLNPKDKFQMSGNYFNFQKLAKGEHIAVLNGKSINAPKPLRIFMPLYQPKGEDGFFYIQRINSFKLKVARVLRQMNAEVILTLIPGIKKLNFYTLVFPKPLLKFIPKRILFAFGYRKSLEIQDYNIHFTKQERKLKELPKIESFKSPYHNLHDYLSD